MPPIPYINLLIAGVFLFFAFNLFGAYEIAVPTKFLTSLDNLTRSKEGEGSTNLGALLMGLTFTLTSFTCTSPFVGTILVTASQGNWQMPFLGMLAFSTVFALPFFAIFDEDGKPVASFPGLTRKIGEFADFLSSYRR